MKNQKDKKIKKQRIEIENKKVWNKWSSNDLYDMYAETTEDGNEFTLHAKGKKKIKTPPPPIDPPGDIMGTLNLLIKRMDSMEANISHGFDEVKEEVKEVQQQVNRLEEKVDNIIKLNHLKTSDDDESDSHN